MNSYNLLNSYQISRTNKLSLDEISLRLENPLIFGVLNFNWKLFSVSFSLSDFLCLCVCLSLPLCLSFCISVQFSSFQSLSRVRLFATPWITARQASLSITNSRSSLKLTSIESVMPSSHLILSSPSPPAPNPSQHQSLFQWVNSSHEVAKVLGFQL